MYGPGCCILGMHGMHKGKQQIESITNLGTESGLTHTGLLHFLQQIGQLPAKVLQTLQQGKAYACAYCLIMKHSSIAVGTKNNISQKSA